MTTPTPTGELPLDQQLTSGITGNFQTDLVSILNIMSSKGYAQLANAFQSFALAYHKQHPALNAKQVLDAFLATELGKALSAGISGTGDILGKVPGAAAKGAGKAVNNLLNPLDLLGGANLGSWFLRVGEILLGLVLIGVGVARITGAENMISKVVKARIP